MVLEKVIEVFNGRLMSLKRSLTFREEEIEDFQSIIKEKENEISELRNEIAQTETAIEILKADKALSKN